MKKRILSAVVMLLFVLFLFPFAPHAENVQEVTVLFTHDLHSHIMPLTRMDGDTPVAVGGFAQIKTILDRERAEADALVVDAGDFSMGTPFQTIYGSSASELRMLGALGFDATTLGNHEFDFGTQQLADMLHAAAESGDALPQLLFHPGELAYEEYGAPATPMEALSDAFAAVGTRQTVLIEKNGVKIGLFSVFGADAAKLSLALELTPPDIVDNAKQAVAALKAEGAELIVCLSHSGTNQDPKKSEDEQLAAAVPGIDVIVSGHTHTYLFEPIVAGDTTIVSCGEYGQYVGKVVLRRAGDRWSVADYTLLPVDASVPADAAAARKIAEFEQTVQETYFSQFGDIRPSDVIARNDGPALPFDVFEQHAESRLGNLIADAYFAATGEDDPPDVAVIPAGFVRWGLPRGELTVADIFSIVPTDAGPGSPLIDYYLTGRELRDAAELDASVTQLMPDAQLYLAGLGFSFHPGRLIFNKVTDVWLAGEDGSRIELEPDRLYRVVCGLGSAKMLGSVKEESFGILSIIPKDENGQPLTDFEACILHDEDGVTMEEWYALMKYVQAFPPGDDGLPAVPTYYGTTHERKVVEVGGGPSIYVTHLNRVSYIVYGAAILLLALAVFLVYRLATRKKRRALRRRKQDHQ